MVGFGGVAGVVAQARDSVVKSPNSLIHMVPVSRYTTIRIFRTMEMDRWMHLNPGGSVFQTRSREMVARMVDVTAEIIEFYR
ncbi:hypothetical protein SAMN05216412_1147 [Nitrosospira multiformis]|uniref:Uncharacterized protein n=1 Tax=Nitrosospira multiformis TaxID=1231 RepID=A0A1I0GKA0_9PROT|nr:hypothetical protein SAMN05216412_1147 [Nitrosospira multiformis]